MGSTSWNGGSGGWGTLANWTAGIPDSATAMAYLNAAGSYTVTLEAGHAYTVNYLGLFNSQNLTLNVLGTLSLAGAGADLYDDYGTIALGGTIAGGLVEITSSETLFDDGGRLTGALLEDLNSDIVLNGHVLRIGSGAIRGGVSGGGTLDITGSVDVGGLYLASGTEVLVTGTALDDGYNTRLDADNGAAPSILSIASTGTYAVNNPNAGMDYTGAIGTIFNAGLFENIDTTASYYNLYNDFTNTGSGILAAGPLVNFSLYGAENDLAGTITGAGEVLLGGGYTTLAANAIVGPGLFAVGNNSATLGLTANRTFATPFNINGNGTVDLDGNTLSLPDTGALDGGIYGPGVLDVSGTYTLDGLQLGSGVTEILSGTEFETSESRLDADGGTAASVLSITGTGTYAVNAPNSDLDNSGSGTVINAGLFENTSTTASYFNIFADFTNTGTGTLDVVSLVSALDSNYNPGDPNFSLYGAHNDLAGTITGAGQILLAGGFTTLAANAVADPGLFAIGYYAATLGLTGNRTFATPFNLNNPGTVDLDGKTLALTDTGALNGGIYGPGVLDVSGTYNVGGLQLGSGITEILSGTEIQTSETRMDTDGGTTVGTVLSITGSGIYDLVSDTQIDNYYGYEGYGTIINAGLFEKTGYNQTSNIYSDFTNTGAGTIFIAADTDLSLLGLTDDLAGTIAGAGELYFGDNGGTDRVTLQAGLVLDPGELVINGYNTQLLLESNRTLAGTFVNQYSATLNLQGNTLTLPGIADLGSEILGTGAVRVTGQGDISGLQLTGGAALVDDGTLTQDGAFNLGVNGGDSAALSIATNAVFDLINNNSIYDNGANATIVNAGLFEKTADDGSSYLYAPFINAGTLVVTHGQLGLQSGGTLAGMLTGAGELSLGGGNFTLAANAKVNVGEFSIDGGALTLSANTSLSDLFALDGGALDLNTYSLSLDNPGDYLASGYIYGPGTVSESGRADLSGINIGNGAVVDDLGTLTQDYYVNLGLNNTDTATLNIARSAEYILLNDNQIGTNGAASTINNAGLFEKIAVNGTSLIDAAFNNSGTGTLTALHGAIALGGGGTLAGRIEGDGAINFQGGVTTLEAGASVGIAAINVDGGTLLLTSNRVFAQSFDETSGALDLAGYSLTLSNADVLQNAALSGGGTLSVTAATLYNYYAGNGSELLDTGTIAQAYGNLYLGFASGDTATLSISAGAVYDFIDDDGIDDNGGGLGTIFNAGLIEKTADNAQSASNAELINTGTLAAVHGSLDFSGGGTLAGTLTGGGQIALSGGVFTLASAAVLNVAQLFLGYSTLELDSNRSYAGDFVQGGGTLALPGASLSLLGAANLDNAYLDGTGTLTVNAVTELSGYNVSYGAVLVDAGTITQDGGFNLGDFGGDTASLSITSRGDFDIINNSYIQSNGAGSTLSNAGLFEKTADNGFSGVQGVLLVNTGTIEAAQGVLGFNAGGTLGGAILGAGEVELYGGTFTLAAAASLGVANLYLDGGALALQKAAGYAGNFTQGSGEIALDGDALTLSGDAALTGGDAAGPGTLVLTGQARLENYGLVAGAVLLAAGSSTQDGSFYIGNASGDSSALEIVAGQTYQIIDDAGIFGDAPGGQGASSLVNAGLLEVTTDNATSYIDYVHYTQSSTGTLAVTRGVLDLHSSDAFIAGTLTGAGEVEADYGNLTLAQSAALDAAALEFLGEATTLGGDFSFAGAMALNGGTLALAGNNLTLAGSAELDSDAFTGPGTVQVTGAGDLKFVTLEDGAQLVDAGTLTQDGQLTAGNGATDSAALTITAGASYEVLNDSNIAAYGNATITNAGLFEKTGAGGDTEISPDFTNTGTGTLAIDSGDVMLRGFTNLLAGTVTGAGGLLVGNGAAVTMASGLALDIAAFTVKTTSYGDAGAAVLGGDLTYAGVFDLNARDFDSGGGGTLELNGYTISLGGFAGLYGLISGPGSLVVSGTGDLGSGSNSGGSALTGGATLVVTGSISQDNTELLSNAATDSAGILIATGGTYDILNDSGIGADGTAAIFNAGLFEKTGATGESAISPVFSNAASGTISALSGELNLGGLVNDGLITIANAQLVASDAITADPSRSGVIRLGPNASFDASGGIGASQTISFTGTNDLLEIGGGTSFAATLAGFTTGDVIDVQGITATALQYHDNTLTLTNDGLTVDSLALTGIADPSSLGLAPDNAGGTDIYFGADVTPTADATDDFWTVSGSGAFNTGTNWSDGVPGALSVAVFNPNNDSGRDLVITDSLSSAIYSLSDNDASDTFAQTAGTLTVADGGGVYTNNASQFDGTFDQSRGAELVSRFDGSVMFSGGTIAGTLAGGGDISFEAPGYGANDVTFLPTAVLDVARLGFGDQGAGNITLVLAGNLGYAGVLTLGNGGNDNGSYLDLQGHTLSLSGGAMFNSGNGGGVAGPGTLADTGTLTVGNYAFAGGAALDVTGALIDDSALHLGNAETDSSAIRIASTGTFDLTADSSVDGSDSQSVNGGVIENAGLLEKTGDNGQSDLNALDFTQAAGGILEVASGILDLDGSGVVDDIAGSVTGAGELEFNDLNVTFASNISLGVASLFLYGATAALSGDLSYAGAFNADAQNSGADLDLNGDDLTLTGAAGFTGGYVSGPGILTLAGSAQVSSSNGQLVEQGAAILVTGTLADTGGFAIGQEYSTTDTAAVSIATGGTLDLTADQNIWQYGATVALTNAGLLEKTGDNGTSYLVFGGFTQVASGTIAIAQGVLDFYAGDDDLAGTFAGAGQAVFESSNVTLAANTALDSGALQFYGSNVTLGGPETYAGALSFGEDTNLFLDGNTLVLPDSAELNSLYVIGPGGIRASAGDVNSLELEAGATLADTGTLTQDAGLTIGNAGTDTAMLAIGAGDIYQILDNAGIGGADSNGAGTNALTNAGLFEKTGDDGTTSIDDINYTQTSTGTLDAASGPIFFDGGNATIAGTLTGAGSVQFYESSVTLGPGLVVDAGELGLFGSATTLNSNLAIAGAFNLDSGNYYDYGTYGTLALNGFNLGLTGAASLDSEAVSGLGTITASGPTDINGLAIEYGAVLSDAGTITQDGGFDIDGNGSLESALLIGAGRVYDILNDNGIYGQNTNGGAGTLVNAGLLEKSASTGTSNIQSVNLTQTSSGTIAATHGELNFYGQSDVIDGSLIGAGEILFQYDNVTFAASVKLDVATLEFYGSNATLTAAMDYAGALDLAGGGTLALEDYNLNLTGGASLGDYVAGPGTITVSSLSDISGLDLQYGAALLDTGTITQDGNLQLGNTVGDLDTLTIAHNAVFNLLNSNGIGSDSYYISGSTYGNTGAIENSGLFEKTADTGISQIYAAFDNSASGTLDIAQGVLYLNGGGTLAGRIEGAGELYIQNYGNYVVTLAADAVLGVAALGVNGTLALENSRLYAGSFADTNLLELNGYNFTLAGAASLDGNVQGSGTLSVTKSADISGLYLYQDSVLADLGTITQDGGFTLSDAGTDSTALSIASGAVYDLLNGNAINANGPATLVNAGLFEKNGDYSNSYIDPAVTNSSTGTIDSVRGFLYFESGGSFAGTLTGSADGTIAQGGIFESGGTMALAAGAAVTAAEFGVTGGTLALGGNLDYSGYFDATGGAIALGGNTLRLTNGYLGNLYLIGPGTLEVTGNAEISGFEPDNGAVLIDAGTFTQDNGFQLGDFSGDTASLSIASGGVYDLVNDNYIGAYGTVAVVNHGLFEKTADHGYSGIESGFTNAANGTLDAALGVLGINGGGVLGGTLAGAGDLDLNSGADTLTSTVVSVAELEIAAASPTLANDLTYGGYFSLDYDDSLFLDSNTLNLTGTADLVGGFKGAGTVAVSGTATVDLLDLWGGTELIVTGSINQIDQLRFGLNDPNPGPSNLLSIAAGGTYNIQNDSPFEDWTPTATASNAGLLEKTGDTGTSQIQPNFTQTGTGTLAIASGIVQFYDQNDLLGGVVTGPGGVAFDQSNVTLAPALALHAASLALTNSNLTLAADPFYAGAFSLAGGEIDLNGANLTLSGTATLGDAPAGYANAVITGPGTLAVAGTAGINGMQLENAAVLFDAGIITQNGAFTLGDAATDTTALRLGAGAVYTLIDGNTLGANGAVAINNAGLLQNDFSLAVTALTENFAQASTGTLAFTTGDLQFDGPNNTLAGTITAAGEIDFETGTNVTLAQFLALDAATLNASGASITLAADQFYTGVLNAPGGSTDLNGFNLTLAGTAGLGAETVSGPGTVVLTGTAELGGLVLENGAQLLDLGSITQDGALTIGDAATDTAALAIGTGGIYDLTNGNAITPGGNVSIVNAGLFEANSLSGVAALDVGFSQSGSGTLLATSGVLELAGGGSLGGMFGGGAGIVALVNTLSFASGAAETATFASGAQFGYTGNSEAFFNGPGTLVSAGTLRVADLGQADDVGNQALNLGGGVTWENTGTVNQAGEIWLGEQANDAATILNTAGAVWNLTTDDAWLYVSSSTSAVFDNAGFLNENATTGYGGQSPISLQAALINTGSLAAGGGALVLSDVTNTGVINAANGATVLIKDGTLGGTVAGAGEMIIDSAGNVTLGPSLEIDISALDLDTAATLNGNISGSGSLFVNTSGSLIGSGTVAATLQNSGLIEATGGTLELDGTVTGSGALYIAPSSELILGPTSDIAGDITFGGTGSVLGLETTATPTLVSLSAGDTIDLIGTTASYATISGDTLLVTLATGGTETFALLAPGSPEHATLSSDGTGGTNITIAPGIISLINLATASSVPSPINLGELHLGGTLSTPITLANLAATGPNSEGLDASFSGTTGALTTAGAITMLAAGASNASALQLTLSAAAVGLVSGTTVLDLTSDGAGIDSIPPTALAPETISVTGTAYVYAAPSLATPLLNFGVLHAGDTAQAALALGNLLTSADEESLDASFSGTSGDVFASGSISRLAAGSTNATSLIAGLDTGTAGVVSGFVTLALASDGAGLDTLGTTGLVSQTIELLGTVDNYATAALEQTGGAGSLTAVGSTQYVLDVGTLQQGSGDLAANLGVLNAAPGLADLLSGGFTISDPDGGFINTGFSSFAGLGAGQADTAPGITLSGANGGTFSELVTLSSAGAGAALPSATLDVTGTVMSAAAPEFTLVSGAGAINAGTLDLPTILGTPYNVFSSSGPSTFDVYWPSDSVLLGVSNGAAAPADLLAGSFSVTGNTAFTNLNLYAFSGSATGLEVILNPTSPGLYTETITLYPSSLESGGYSRLAPEQLVIEAEAAFCFCAGTEILTTGGPVAVEHLRIGDCVQTLNRGRQPIKWIGRRAYDGRFIAGKHLMLPVCIRASALSPGLPVRDLWVSPGHAILVAGALVPAWRLLNGTTVVQAEDVARVEYFHLELAGHEMIFAEQVPAETYFNEAGRLQFQNGGEFAELYGDTQAGKGLARTESGFALEAIRCRLGGGAAAGLGGLRGFIDSAGPELLSGWAQHAQAPELPVCLDVLRGGRRISRVLANVYRADLRAAGLGSGCHGFELVLPPGPPGALEVRRATDKAALPRTEAAMSRAA